MAAMSCKLSVAAVGCYSLVDWQKLLCLLTESLGNYKYRMHGCVQH